MHRNHYDSGSAVLLAVDLANDPPRSPADLTARCEAAGLALDAPAGPDDLRAVRALLPRWTEVVDAPGAAARAELLNRLMAEASAYPRLTDHRGDGWHLHHRDDGISAGDVLRAWLPVGTALHLAARGMDRLGRCGLAECDRVYADVSRAGRQRYCSPRCANRDAVRRHRARSS